MRVRFPYFCPMYGSMDETVGHVMYECVELSRLKDEVCGKSEFDQKWQMNLTRDDFFVDIKNSRQFPRLAMGHRSRFF